MSGGNGVYRYTSTPSTFPTRRWQSENYWVDVVFTDGQRHHEADGDRPDPGRRRDRGRRWAATSPRRSPSRCSRRPSPSSCGHPAAPSCRPRCPTMRRAARRRSARRALWRRRRPTRPTSGARDTAGNQMDPVTWSSPPTTPRHDQADGDRSRPRPSVRPGWPVGSVVHGDVQRAGAAGHDRASRCRGPGNTLVPRHDDLRRRQPHGHAAPRTPTWLRAPRYTVNLNGAKDASGNSHGPGVRGRSPRRRCTGLPLHDLARRRRRRPALTVTPARSSSGVKFRSNTDGFVTGIRYYQAARRPPAPTSAASGRDRDPPRPRSRSPAARRRGWQQANLRDADPGHGRDDVRRVVLHADSRYVGQRRRTSPPARPRAGR